MIAGNPNAGRRIAAIAIIILFLALLSGAWVAMRKKSMPENEPPLHPITSQ
jgi:hypothetical protein